MARSVAALLDVMGIQPEIAVGHSAGAAILARMCLDGRINPATLVSLNGAFLPLRGLPVQLLSPITRLLVAIPAVPRIVARVATGEGAVRRLLDDTGSNLTPAQIGFYRRLFCTPNHVAAALGMMANWRLEMLEADLARLPQSLVLIVADKDGMIPPSDAARIRTRVPTARIVTLSGIGHLAHEEDPDTVAGLIEALHERPRRRARS
jgi:putative magnesium chelatase accessory protein